MSREPRRAWSKRRLLRGPNAVLVAFAASTVATLIPAVMTAQTAKDSAAVAARIDAYKTAWDTHDASAVAALFTEDADFVMGNQPAAVGRRAIDNCGAATSRTRSPSDASRWTWARSGSPRPTWRSSTSRRPPGGATARTETCSRVGFEAPGSSIARRASG